MIKYFFSVPVQYAIRVNVFVQDAYIWLLDNFLIDPIAEVGAFLFERGEEPLSEVFFVIAEKLENLAISLYKCSLERYQDFLIGLMIRLGWEIES